MTLLANTMNVDIRKVPAGVPENITDLQAYELQRYAVQNDTIDEEMMRYVEEGRADTIAYPFQRTRSRTERVLFSHKLYTAKLFLFHRHFHENESRQWSFFQVYDDRLWMLIGLILLAQMFFYVFHNAVEHGLDLRSIGDAFWYSIQIHLGRPVQGQHTTTAVRFNMVSVSFMHVAIVLGLYSSWIVSQRFHKHDELLSGWADVFQRLDKGNMYLALPKDDFFYERLMEAEAHPFTSLHELYQKKPSIIKFCPNQRECLSWANSSNALFPLLDESTLHRAMKFYCKIVPPKHPMLEMNARLIFKKGDEQLMEKFDEAIQKNEFMLKMIHNRYVSRIQEPPELCREKPSVDQPYQGLFTIYTCLMITASLACCIEILVAKRKCTPNAAFRSNSNK
ncbi:unnamed protein product [Bursaphelenchus xylophilus]|uniref:(pine wood nematode) hypothetical protein n=1 Tax=Bursaphelenchus xylophilus TaxID=6326 RepID=A0A1I7SCQ2_BURXY|nr:unnamed protein product [Bursaphelenchus xylophilus]CAG9093693.1 unnamed protein product [Bursaphelenchus xylophilus]